MSEPEINQSCLTLDEHLAQAFPKSQHPVKAWRLIASGEPLWSGPEIGSDGRPEIGTRRETYAEHVNRVANEAGYASGFGVSQVYEMLKRVRHFDALDRGILDYLEQQPILRRGLAKMLDGLAEDSPSAEQALQAAKDWLAERGAYARPDRDEVDPDDRDIEKMRAMLAKRPLDTVAGKRFRTRAMDLFWEAT